MARVLHISASPRGEQSYSLRAAEAFLEAYKESHPDDEVITLDLARDKIPDFGPLSASGKYKIMFGQEQTAEEEQEWADVKASIEDVKAADKLVISAPMWNFGIPYRLKQWIDVIVQPGHTFSFSPEEGYTGLLTGRPAALFLARGGEYSEGDGAAVDYQKPYLEWILQFIGITESTTFVVEPTLQGGQDAAEEALQSVIEQAQAKAKEF